MVSRREVLKRSYGGGGMRELAWFKFYEMKLTTLDIMLAILNLVTALWLIDDVNHHMHLFLTCT